MNYPCLKTELSLFDPPLTQVTMERAVWVDVHPLASLHGNGPLEFSITGAQDEYLDLNDSALYLKMRIVKKDGSDMDNSLKPYTTNLTLATLFSDVSLYLNDTLVEGGHHMYPYKAYISTLLQYDDGAKITQFQAAGYDEDKDNRIAWFTGSKWKEFMGALHLDMFSQSRYLLPGVTVRIKLNRSKPEFVLMNNGKADEVKIVMEKEFTSSGCSLFVYNLTADLSASGACGQPYQTGNLRLDMKFGKALPQAINVIVMALRDGRIEITKQRQVIKCL